MGIIQKIKWLVGASTPMLKPELDKRWEQLEAKLNRKIAGKGKLLYMELLDALTRLDSSEREDSRNRQALKEYIIKIIRAVPVYYDEFSPEMKQKWVETLGLLSRE